MCDPEYSDSELRAVEASDRDSGELWDERCPSIPVDTQSQDDG